MSDMTALTHIYMGLRLIIECQDMPSPVPLCLIFVLSLPIFTCAQNIHHGGKFALSFRTLNPIVAWIKYKTAFLGYFA